MIKMQNSASETILYEKVNQIKRDSEKPQRKKHSVIYAAGIHLYRDSYSSYMSSAEQVEKVA